MTRRLLFLFLLALLLSLSAAAATCDLQMTVSCTPEGACTSTTTNAGTGVCTGEYYSGWLASGAPRDVTFSGHTNTLGLTECFDSGEFGLEVAFVICFGGASLGPGASFTSNVNVGGAVGRVPILSMTLVADPETDEERASAFAYADVVRPSCTPTISAPPLVRSGADYTVTWTAVADAAAQYTIEESTTPDFTANVVSSTVNSLAKTFHHDVAAATRYYYRVRATQCAGGTPESSRVTETVVEAPPPPVRESGEAAVPVGSTTPVQFQVFLPGRGASAIPFEASTDQPFLSVTPASGQLPPEGTNLTVTANPTGLQPGANTGTLRITSNSTPLQLVPLSLSLVTPVGPGTKTTPPANALLIPIVTHVLGGAGPFLTDVRLTNGSASTIKYQVTFSPTRSNATQTSKTTEVTVESQQTIALNDIVKNFFGLGATGDVGFGSLEVRPLNTSSLLTYASSRTYASTALGTFGQFIAAVPLTRFATNKVSSVPIPGVPAPPVSNTLSLQHVSQSVKFRTNFGIAEGIGEPASGRIRIYDALGQKLSEVPFNLQPGEHQQLNGFLGNPGNVPTLDDGRLEVIVDSPTGAVTAYASVLDNVTTDPLAVMPVDVSKINATRYVLPGVAELPGENNFHSDVRVFNGGTSDVTINMTYYEQGNAAPVSAAPRTIKAGEILILDNILPTVFNETAGGGSVLFTSTGASSLVVTGRTYTNVAGGGTYGQFIPGVTPAEGTGLGERPLQVLQLEQSEKFRSNVGLVELTGNPVRVRVSLYRPDTKVTASTEIDLGANQFFQDRMVERLNPGQQTYNARITVEVVGGSGRVAAYGSVIDNKSKDPTYVPAQ